MKKLEFRFQNMLHCKNDNTVSGAMSPVLFANEMSKQMGEKYNGLTRVWFQDDKVNQVMEYGEGLTGYDTLILVDRKANDTCFTMYVDMGVNGIPVALYFTSDEEAILTPIYQKSKFEHVLTLEEVKQVFDALKANPDAYIPRNEHLLELA